MMMMSMVDDGEQIEADTLLCCASCGIAENDDVKLMPCDDCDLVRYCGVACQRDHKSEHEEACKKREAELRDELLFKQPECTHLGDCPICMISLPLDVSKYSLNGCCSKLICDGCRYANKMREMEMRLQHKCPFCREPIPSTEEEVDKQTMKRVEANDPVAMVQQGGSHIMKGEYQSAFEYWTKAAELGHADAHYQLSVMYYNGHGVEKDERKQIYHYEEAAIIGHPRARFMLGDVERENENYERAVKHFIIAAAQGDDESIKMLMDGFKKGFVEKDDLAVALRAHQAAVDATKSPQREKGEEFYRNMD